MSCSSASLFRVRRLDSLGPVFIDTHRPRVRFSTVHTQVVLHASFSGLIAVGRLTIYERECWKVQVLIFQTVRVRLFILNQNAIQGLVLTYSKYSQV